MEFTLHASAERLLSSTTLSLQALSADELAGTTEIVRTVIPAPGPDGRLAARTGPTQRVSDPAALAAALNAQHPDVRIDFDHQSEPRSRTFRGSTAAEGWAKNFRVAAGGAIEAALELSSFARHSIESGRYRYLSPAIWFEKDTGEVIGMSSLALVNNPNLQLRLNDGEQPSIENRERRAAEREEAATRLMMNAAERSVDAAVQDKRLAPAQKGFVLNSIRTHPDGIEKGIEAFEAAFPAGSPALNSLDRRTAPAGAPAAAPAARFHGPQGAAVSEDGLQLHAQVAQHAQQRGISYRQAVMELGALQQ